MHLRLASIALLTALATSACSSCAPTTPGDDVGEGEGAEGEGEGAEGEGAEGEGAEGEGAEGEGAEGEGAEGEGAEGEGAEGEGEGAEGEGAEGEGEGAEGEGAEGEGEGEGVGEGEGAAAECNLDDDCPDSGNLCAPARCFVDQDPHFCGSANLPFGTFIDAQVAGDCNDAICAGDGSTTTQPNNSDVGFDDSACTVDGCANGSATHILDVQQGAVDQAQENASGSVALTRNNDVGQTFTARSGIVTAVEVDVDYCGRTSDFDHGSLVLAVSAPQRGALGSVDVPVNDIGCLAGFTTFDLTSLCIASTAAPLAFDLQIRDASPGICNVAQCVSGEIGALCLVDSDCDVVLDVNDDVGDPYAPGSEINVDGDVVDHDLAFRVHVR